MFEVIIGFFLGYIIGRAIETANTLARKPDKILVWHPESLGYRPVPPASRVKPNTSYLLCYEVQSVDKKR